MTKQQKEEQELDDFAKRYRNMDFPEIISVISKRQNNLPYDVLFLEIPKYIHKLDTASVGLLSDFKTMLSKLLRLNTMDTPENEDYLQKIRIALKAK